MPLTRARSVSEQVISASGDTVTGTHTTPVSHYIDELNFTFVNGSSAGACRMEVRVQLNHERRLAGCLCVWCSCFTVWWLVPGWVCFVGDDDDDLGLRAPQQCCYMAPLLGYFDKIAGRATKFIANVND